MQGARHARSVRGRLIAAADYLDWAIGLFCRGLALLTGSLLLLLLGVNVLVRYAFAGGDITWISEVPEQLFPWFIAAGVVLAVQEGAHIAVDMLLLRLGPGGQRWLVVAINLLVAAAYLVLTRTALKVAAITSVEHSPILGLPRSLGYDALATGAVLMAITSLTIALRVGLQGAEARPQSRAEESVT